MIYRGHSFTGFRDHAIYESTWYIVSMFRSMLRDWRDEPRPDIMYDYESSDDYDEGEGDYSSES